MKKRKKKSFLLFLCLVFLMSICVYCSLPVKIQPDIFNIQTTEEKTEDDEELDVSAMEDLVEAYFQGRPVRDIPDTADFASFLKASLAKKEKNFAILANSYEKVLQGDKENEDVKTSLYVYFVLSGNIEKGAFYAKQVLETNKDNTMALTAVLADLVKKEKYDEAFVFVDKLDSSHQNFLSPIIKSWLYVAKKDVRAAEKSLEHIQKKEFRSAVLLTRGSILDYFGKIKEAAKNYDALMQTPELKNARVLMTLQEFEKRTFLITNKNLLKETYSKMEEDSFISKEMMSQNKTGERVKNPKEGLAWVFFDLASLLVTTSEPEMGLYYAQLAYYLNPKSSIIRLFVGEVFEAINLPEEANKLYEKVELSENIYLSSRMRIVLNLIKMNRLNEAEENMTALLKSNPNIPLFYMTMGDVNREMKKYEQAITNYKKALSFFSSEDKQMASIFFNLGVCYEALFDTEKSTNYFEKALNLDAKNPIYLNYVGYSWVEQDKNLSEALKLIEKAVVAVPNNGMMLDSLGWAHFKLKNYDKAVTFLEKAVSLEAGNAVINSHLGDVYWKLKRYREAKFQWAHAATLKQESSEKLLNELSAKLAYGLSK